MPTASSQEDATFGHGDPSCSRSSRPLASYSSTTSSIYRHQFVYRCLDHSEHNTKLFPLKKIHKHRHQHQHQHPQNNPTFFLIVFFFFHSVTLFLGQHSQHRRLSNGMTTAVVVAPVRLATSTKNDLLTLAAHISDIDNHPR